jgi:hypothetical protein
MFAQRKWMAISLGLFLVLGRTAGAQTDDRQPVTGALVMPPGDNPPPVSGALVWPSTDSINYGTCDPLWTASAEGLFLNRSRPAHQSLLVDNAGTSIYDANQLDFPTQLGWEIDVQRRVCCDWSVEALYFQLGGENAKDLTLSTFGAGVPYNTPPAATGIFGGPGPVLTGLDYSSKLQNVEFNARRELTPNVSLLAGVRYLGLYEDGLTIEQLATFSNPSPALPSLIGDIQKFSVFNNLIGFQVGADATFLRWGRFSLEGNFKAGIYGDAASNRISYDYASTSPLALYHFVSGTTGGSAAFVGELGIRETCQIVGGWSIFAGYDLLWIDGVALASQQAAANPSPNPSPGNTWFGPASNVQMGSSLFYQGATAGVEFRY